MFQLSQVLKPEMFSYYVFECVMSLQVALFDVESEIENEDAEPNLTMMERLLVVKL